MTKLSKLLEVLSNKGITLAESVISDEKEVFKIAQQFGIEPLDYMSRSVQLVKRENKKTKEISRFIVTSPYIIGRKKDGMAKKVKGLDVPVDAIPQMVQDLQAALLTIEKESSET